MILCGLAFVEAAPTSSVGADLIIPEGNDNARAAARASINELLQSGQDENACEELANQTIKQVEDTVNGEQKMLDELDDGSACPSLGQDAVDGAQKIFDDATKAKEDADEAHKAAQNADVSFAPKPLNTLTEGQCDVFFEDPAFTEAVKAEMAAKSDAEKAAGEVTAADEALNAAKDAQAKAIKECQCKVRADYDKAWEAANKANDENKKAYTQGKHMLCIIKHMGSCDVGAVPAVTPKTLAAGVPSSGDPSCPAPDCQGCACGPGNANPIPTWTTDSLLQQSSTSGGNWISTKKITSAPPSDSTLIPHPKYVVNIAYRNGNKFRDTEFRGFKDYVFSDTAKYKLTHVSDLTKIPEDTDIMFDFLPTQEYTSTEIEALKTFLDAGFRLVMMGEHSGYAPTENAHISKAVAAMGGGVEVDRGTLNLKEMTAAKNQIADVAVAAGVFKFGTAAWAPLKVDADVTEVVMADSNGKIFMADQVLRKGRLTIWADKNVWANEHGNKDGRNMGMFYNLVHQAAFYKKEVKAGRDPNAYANEKLKAEKEGKPPPPKPVVVYEPTTTAPPSGSGAGSGTGDSTCQARCCK